jgi:allantoin racemase
VNTSNATPHNAPMRILWQSSTPITKYPAYNDAIVAHAARVLGTGVEVVVRGTLRPTFGTYTRAAFFLKSSDMMDSIVSAADEGFDGVGIGCFLDPILHELREILDIPVMGLAETGMHMACMLGQRFAILSHSGALNVKVYDSLAERYGLRARMSGMYAVDLPMDALEKAITGDPAPAVALITEAAERLVADGAEVIVPGCGLLNLLCVQQGLSQVAGAAVLDVTGALLKMTETMITLRRVSGTGVSRNGYYARPSETDVRKTLASFGRGKVDGNTSTGAAAAASAALKAAA